MLASHFAAMCLCGVCSGARWTALTDEEKEPWEAQAVAAGGGKAGTKKAKAARSESNGAAAADGGEDDDDDGKDE